MRPGRAGGELSSCSPEVAESPKALERGPASSCSAPGGLCRLEGLMGACRWAVGPGLLSSA